MRIFLTGSQGTGKSTLVKSISDLLPEYELLDSMSRKFMDSIDDQLSEDFQNRISLYCLNLYVNHKDFICSRSYFDSLAYPIDNNIGGRYDYLIDMVRYYSKYLFQKDCIYFYIPIEFQITKGNNDLRIDDLDYQERIDNIIKDEIQRVKFDNVYSISGSIEDRVEYIKSILNYKGLLR